MLVSPQNSQMEILPPEMMVFGSELFRRWVGQEGGVPMNGMCGPIRGDPREIASPLSLSLSAFHHGRMQGEVGHLQTSKGSDQTPDLP